MKGQSYNNFTNILEISRVQYLNLILTKLASLQALDTKQMEEKSVNIHLVNWLISGKNYFNSSILSELLSIGSQCVLEHSYAVPIARALYNQEVDFDFDDSVYCSNAQPLISGVNDNRKSGESLKVYPNPVESNVLIELVSDQVLISELNVFNAKGESILKFKIDKPTVLANISLAENPNGIYFIHVIDTNGKKYYSKIIWKP